MIREAFLCNTCSEEEVISHFSIDAMSPNNHMIRWMSLTSRGFLSVDENFPLIICAWYCRAIVFMYSRGDYHNIFFIGMVDLPEWYIPLNYCALVVHLIYFIISILLIAAVHSTQLHLNCKWVEYSIMTFTIDVLDFFWPYGDWVIWLNLSATQLFLFWTQRWHLYRWTNKTPVITNINNQNFFNPIQEFEAISSL